MNINVNDLSKAIESKIDKSKWVKWRFSDLVENIVEKVVPKECGLENYIGLKHLDTGSLKIRRYGKCSEISGDKLKIYKGDLIFAKRNSYLKRVAIADFDAVASAHSLVLRAKSKNINPDFLPFFLMSETFWTRAIEISVGSLSPTINWRVLAKQEFLLPPKEQQVELAELFWSINNMIETEKAAYTKLNLYLEANIEAQLHGIELEGKTVNQVLDELEKKTEVLPLNKLGKTFKGKGITKSEVIETGIPCIRYGELYTKHHRIIREYHSFITSESASKSIVIKKGDVLIAGSGETISEIGKSASFIGEETVYAGSDIIIFRPDDMNEKYSGYLMNSILVRQQLNKVGTGATVMHIYGSDIAKIRVPVIGRNKQREIVNHLEEIFKNITLIKLRENKTITLQKSLINQVF